MKNGLRISFIIHFVLDVLFAVPLMLFPDTFLSLLGWRVVEPITARVVAAALFGIGIESLLSRNEQLNKIINLLRLKIIWSASALAGLLLSFVQGYFTCPGVALLFIGIFLGFNLLWLYWFVMVSDYLRTGE